MRLEGAAFYPGDLAVSFYPGEAGELVVVNGAQEFLLLDVSLGLTTGSNAQQLEARLLDRNGAYWRKLRFGAKVQVRIQGVLQPTSYVIGKRNLAHLGGGSVMVTLNAYGRTQVLYSEPLLVDVFESNQTTAYIAKSVIDSVFAGVLDTSLINTASGVLQAEFEASAGDNVGDVLERLTKIDGYTFDVDDQDRVRYYQISTTSQATFTEDDLDGDPRESPVEDGVQPPVTLLRVKGTSGYAAKTRQETQDQTRELDASTTRVAQRFKAVTPRLSGVELYADWTDRNVKPNTMSFEVQTDSKVTHTSTDLRTGTGTGHTTDAAGKGVAQTFTTPNDPDQPLVLEAVLIDALSGPTHADYVAEIRTVDGATGKPTSTVLASAVLANVISSGAGIAPGIEVAANTKYALVIRRTTGTTGDSWEYHSDVANSDGWITTDGGVTWSAGANPDWAYMVRYQKYVPSGTKVVWSDDVSLGAGDLAYPPSWSLTKSWSKPKLLLTRDAYYWLVVKDTSPGASRWLVGYTNVASVYADGHAAVSTNSGSTWSTLAHDLTFRLYWTQDLIDMTITNARSKLSGSMTDSQNTVPVNELDDFADADTATIEAEDVTWTGRSATTGTGNLTGVTRGANGTTPATHASGKWVKSAAIRDYGVWQRTIVDENIQSEAEARAVANVVFTKNRDPAKRFTLTLKRLRGDLTPRNVVTIKRPTLDINGDYEVAEVRHEAPEGGMPRTTIIVGTLEYDATRALEELRKAG